MDMLNRDVVVKINNLKKKYKLGLIGGTTLAEEFQRWWARKLGKPDPTAIIGDELDSRQIGEDFWALNGIDLEVQKGEAVGIIGLNGAGKSTLLKILSRVTAPTDGEVMIKGRITSMLEVGTGFHGELTGRENIYMNGAILGMNKKEVDEKIEDIIDFSECRKFIDTPVKRYSSGMYVKLAFSVAAHLNSEIMIMDEVLAVGDMKFQEKCLGKMGNAAAKEGKTILYVSHNMNTIRQLCTRCVVMENGKIVFNGDVERAIDIYMDKKVGDAKIYYDLENSKRYYLGDKQNIKLSSFKLLNKREPIYIRGEKIQFCITWKKFKPINNIRLMVTVISSENGMIGPVASTVSKVFVTNAMTDEGKNCFEVDISRFTAGKYGLTLCLFEKSNLGHFCKIDMPDQTIPFEVKENVEENDYLQWEKKFWGNIRLDEMKIMENEA